MDGWEYREQMGEGWVSLWGVSVLFLMYFSSIWAIHGCFINTVVKHSIWVLQSISRWLAVLHRNQNHMSIWNVSLFLLWGPAACSSPVVLGHSLKDLPFGHRPGWDPRHVADTGSQPSSDMLLGATSCVACCSFIKTEPEVFSDISEKYCYACLHPWVCICLVYFWELYSHRKPNHNKAVFSDCEWLFVILFLSTFVWVPDLVICSPHSHVAHWPKLSSYVALT